jgi:4-carboxymuconolactone decarboxylase
VTRLPPLPTDQLSAAQRAVYEAITGGRRASGGSPFELVAGDGSLLGPFGAMLRSPRIGNAVQHLGELLRYESSLRDDVRELAILTVAQAWQSEFEWYAHAAIGARVGVPPEAIQALREGRRPERLDAEQAAAYDLCLALDTQRKVPDEVYTRAREHLGEQGVVDLVFLYGYYVLVAATLSAFDIGLPDGATTAFPPGER